MTRGNSPIAGGYWVLPDQLLVGPYPSAFGTGDARAQVESLLACGVRSFVNLMHEDPRGLPPYEGLARELADQRNHGCTLHRFPIEDCSVPSLEHMDRIVAAIDGDLARGLAVYAHCWGGRGRAGIVAGVFLIRSGRAAPDDVVHEIARLRGRDARTHPSPETAEQQAFVRAYCAARPPVRRPVP